MLWVRGPRKGSLTHLGGGSGLVVRGEREETDLRARRREIREGGEMCGRAAMDDGGLVLVVRSTKSTSAKSCLSPDALELIECQAIFFNVRNGFAPLGIIFTCLDTVTARD